MEKNKPVFDVKLGRIKATVWANETPKGVRHNVNVLRIYKDGDDWKESASFGRDDLLLLIKVLDIAHTKIFEQQNQDN
jgi:hypothetical protein